MKKIIILLLATTQLIAANFQLYKGNLTHPTLNLVETKGNPHSLQDYTGSVVLVQFWTTYCPPCIKEMPSMNHLQEELKQQNIPFKILAINMSEDKNTVLAFMKKVKPEFTILLDESGENINTWGVFAAPSNFVIDKRHYSTNYFWWDRMG